MTLRNEMFLPGRMAYVFQVDDDYTDTDIPTTLLRSKADCPTLEVNKNMMKLPYNLFINSNQSYEIAVSTLFSFLISSF